MLLLWGNLVSLILQKITEFGNFCGQYQSEPIRLNPFLSLWDGEEQRLMNCGAVCTNYLVCRYVCFHCSKWALSYHFWRTIFAEIPLRPQNGWMKFVCQFRASPQKRRPGKMREIRCLLCGLLCVTSEAVATVAKKRQTLVLTLHHVMPGENLQKISCKNRGKKRRRRRVLHSLLHHWGENYIHTVGTNEVPWLLINKRPKI